MKQYNETIANGGHLPPAEKLIAEYGSPESDNIGKFSGYVVDRLASLAAERDAASEQLKINRRTDYNKASAARDKFAEIEAEARRFFLYDPVIAEVRSLFNYGVDDIKYKQLEKSLFGKAVDEFAKRFKYEFAQIAYNSGSAMGLGLSPEIIYSRAADLAYVSRLTVEEMVRMMNFFKETFIGKRTPADISSAFTMLENITEKLARDIYHADDSTPGLAQKQDEAVDLLDEIVNIFWDRVKFKRTLGKLEGNARRRLLGFYNATRPAGRIRTSIDLLMLGYEHKLGHKVRRLVGGRVGR